MFNCVSAIDFAEPSAFWYVSVRFPTFSWLFDKTNNAVWALRPTSSIASVRVKPLSLISANASLTGLPVVAISEKIRRKAVPADDPLMPLSANAPSIAVVSSNETPAAFDTGATYFIDSAKLSISNADVENDLAITSVMRCISLAFKPNARNVDPATSALLAKSVPVAPAKDRVDSVAFKISVSLKPNFANSVCNCATSPAVNLVVAPRRFASSLNAMILSCVVPRTDAKFATPWSKSFMAPNAERTIVDMPKAIPSLLSIFCKPPNALL